MEEANDFRTRVERALQAPPRFEGVFASTLPRQATSQDRAVQAARASASASQPTGLRDPGPAVTALLVSCSLVEPLMFLSFPRLAELTLPLFFLG